MPPVFPGNCLYLHLKFVLLGTGGLKLLLKDFQAYHSIICDQDEGMFHFHLSQIFFFQEKMKRALAKGAGQWEMETMGILKAESNKSI